MKVSEVMLENQLYEREQLKKLVLRNHFEKIFSNQGMSDLDPFENPEQDLSDITLRNPDYFVYFLQTDKELLRRLLEDLLKEPVELLEVQRVQGNHPEYNTTHLKVKAGLKNNREMNLLLAPSIRTQEVLDQSFLMLKPRILGSDDSHMTVLFLFNHPDLRKFNFDNNHTVILDMPHTENRLMFVNCSPLSSHQTFLEEFIHDFSTSHPEDMVNPDIQEHSRFLKNEKSQEDLRQLIERRKRRILYRSYKKLSLIAAMLAVGYYCATESISMEEAIEKVSRRIPVIVPTLKRELEGYRSVREYLKTHSNLVSPNMIEEFNEQKLEILFDLFNQYMPDSTFAEIMKLSEDQKNSFRGMDLSEEEKELLNDYISRIELEKARMEEGQIRSARTNLDEIIKELESINEASASLGFHVPYMDVCRFLGETFLHRKRYYTSIPYYSKLLDELIRFYDFDDTFQAMISEVLLALGLARIYSREIRLARKDIQNALDFAKERANNSVHPEAQTDLMWLVNEVCELQEAVEDFPLIIEDEDFYEYMSNAITKVDIGKLETEHIEQLASESYVTGRKLLAKASDLLAVHFFDFSIRLFKELQERDVSIELQEYVMALYSLIQAESYTSGLGRDPEFHMVSGALLRKMKNQIRELKSLLGEEIFADEPEVRQEMLEMISDRSADLRQAEMERNQKEKAKKARKKKKANRKRK